MQGMLRWVAKEEISTAEGAIMIIADVLRSDSLRIRSEIAQALLLIVISQLLEL